MKTPPTMISDYGNFKKVSDIITKNFGEKKYGV